MNDVPARGLPPRIYLPMLFALLVIFGIPIAVFLQRGFGTQGSAINQGAMGAVPPPEIAKVIGQLRTRIAQNPRDAEALESLAGLELDAGKIQDASQLQAQAVAVRPQDAALRAVYAQSLSDLGQLAAARAQTDILVRQNAKNPDGYFLRGTIEERLGERAAADRDYAAFLRVAGPNDPRRTQVLVQSGGS